METSHHNIPLPDPPSPLVAVFPDLSPHTHNIFAFVIPETFDAFWHYPTTNNVKVEGSIEGDPRFGFSGHFYPQGSNERAGLAFQQLSVTLRRVNPPAVHTLSKKGSLLTYMYDFGRVKDTQDVPPPFSAGFLNRYLVQSVDLLKSRVQVAFGGLEQNSQSGFTNTRLQLGWDPAERFHAEIITNSHLRIESTFVSVLLHQTFPKVWRTKRRAFAIGSDYSTFAWALRLNQEFEAGLFNWSRLHYHAMVQGKMDRRAALGLGLRGQLGSEEAPRIELAGQLKVSPKLRLHAKVDNQLECRAFVRVELGSQSSVEISAGKGFGAEGMADLRQSGFSWGAKLSLNI